MLVSNNKALLLLLSSILLSSGSAATLTSSIRRVLEENADLLSELQDIDLSCAMSMADTAESCNLVSSASDNEACVWCPIGADAGGCVPQSVATIVNDAGIPHFHCGPQEDKAVTEADDVFFANLENCAVTGATGEGCQSDSICQWCVTKSDPTFGICYSEEFVSEAKTMVAMFEADLDDATMPDQTWDDILDCGNEDGTYSEGLLEVGAISDMECVVNGNPEDMFSDVTELCTATMDSSNKPCVIVNLFGFMDFCVTATQSEIVLFVLDQLNDMGIDDPMALMGGFGGDGPVLGGGDTGDFDEDFGDGDFNDPALFGFDDFGDEPNEDVAGEVNEMEETEEYEDETGQ